MAAKHIPYTPCIQQTIKNTTMKTIIKALFIGLFILSLSSCAKKKLSQSWVVVTFKEDGVDRTSDFHLLFPNYTITFHDAGDFVASAQPLGIPLSLTGTWTFEDGGKKIKLVYDDQNEGTQVWNCHKLTNDELEVSRQADTKEEISFVAK